MRREARCRRRGGREGKGREGKERKRKGGREEGREEKIKTRRGVVVGEGVEQWWQGDDG